MGLFDTIDGLLGGARYLAWGIALVCIPASLVLLIANLAMGVGAALACVAALFAAVGVTLLLLPKPLAKGPLAHKFVPVVGGIALVIAIAVMGIDFVVSGSLPQLNLIFM